MRATPKKNNPFGTTPARASASDIEQATPVKQAVVVPGIVILPKSTVVSARTEEPDVVPATYVSTPQVVSAQSFLAPKQYVVPKATPTRVTEPVHVPAPAPAPVPEPVKQSALVSGIVKLPKSTVVSARTEEPDVVPATYVSTPQVVTAQSFLAPKQYVVPKAAPTRVAEPVHAPVQAAPIAPIGAPAPALAFTRPAIVPLGKKIVPLSAPAPAPAAPAPVVVSAPHAQGNPCAVCSKAVYLMDQIKVEETCYHRWCFRCCECQATLKPGNYASAHGSLYCKPHFKQLFALRGNYDEGFGTEKHTVKVRINALKCHYF